ncbi:MAG: DUF4296 domain-containing protein [Bacteroidetes bacterium]|nr:MAG: DUF4296 domain-containing protein [Bacteroidota bacterium]
MQHLPLGGVLALVLLTAGACSVVTEPDPPVADSTLVAVLADLHLADVRASLVHDVPPGTRDSVLAHHGLTPAEFEAALRYYVERPDAYLELYNRVLDHLTEESMRPAMSDPAGPSEPPPSP